MSMIVLDRHGVRFNYRIVGVCVHDNHVLLQTAQNIDFWFLPGGRCEMGESSIEALQREMREEMGLDIEIARLLWVVENFFEHGGIQFHELALFYEVRLPASSNLLRTDAILNTTDAGTSIDFRWFALADLPNLRLVPAFLRTELRRLPECPHHLIHRDEEGE